MYDGRTLDADFPEIGTGGFSAPVLHSPRTYEAADRDALAALGIRAAGRGLIHLGQIKGQFDLAVTFSGDDGQSLTIGDGAALSGSISMTGNGARTILSGCGAPGGQNSRLTLILVDGARAYFGKGLISIGSSWNIFKTRLVVGDNHLASWEVFARNHDGHAIFDHETKAPLNNPRDILIGPHVWLGQRSYVVKGVEIGEGAIVGACAVVTKPVEPRCAVAGNPAKVVRRNVDWALARYAEGL